MKKYKTNLVIDDSDNGNIEIKLNILGPDRAELRAKDLSPALVLAYFTQAYAKDLVELCKHMTNEDMIKLLQDKNIKLI